LGPHVGTATPTPRCDKTTDDAVRQHMGDEAIGYAHDIKLEALRLLGTMLEATKRNQGAVKGKTGSKSKPVLDPTPTLADLGLDKKTSLLAVRHRNEGGACSASG